MAHAHRMRTPHLPKKAPWRQEDEDHLQKVLATFPPWNAEQIAVARRCFGAAQARIEAREEAERQHEIASNVDPHELPD